MNKLKLLLRKPSNAPLEEIEISTTNTLEELCTHIGCRYIESIPLREDIYVLLDEEARLKEGYEEKTNFWYDSFFEKDTIRRLVHPDWVFGTVIIVGKKNSEIVSITPSQREFIEMYLFD